MERMSVDFKEETTISEFIGCCDSWNFLKSTTPYLLPRKVEGLHLKMDKYRETACYGQVQKKLLIYLGEYPHQSLWQTVISTKTDQLCFPNIQKVFIAAVDEALDEFNGRDDWNCSTKCCSTYASALVCSNCRAKFTIEIGVDFVKDFGATFNKSFKRRIRDLVPECDTFTVAMGYNPHGSVDFENTMDHFYHLDQFTDLEITFTKDLSTTGQALFWDRDTVVEFMQSAPDKEFFPALMNRFGDFAYYKKRDIGEGFKMHNIKFLVELFKSNTKKTDALFSKPFIADLLAGNEDGLCRKGKWDQVDELGWLPTYQAVVEKYTKKDMLVARVQASVVKNNPTVEALQKFKAAFDRSMEPAITLIKSFPMEQIRMYLEKNLIPPINTLMPLVQNKLQSRTAHKPNLDDLKLASLCEGIMCFAIHGSCFKRGDEPMQSELLICDFGLQSFNFNRGADFCGLGNLPNVTVVENEGKDVIKIVDTSSVPLYINYRSVEEKQDNFEDMFEVDV